MNDDVRLQELTILELNILLGHLQLGMGHLKQHLDNTQLTKLLNHAWLKENQHEKIKSDGAEKRGNIAIMVNTVFTCVVGAWLASIGFLGISPATNMYFLLAVLAVAGIASGYFGYISYKKVSVEAEEAVNGQKLINLRLKILDIVKDKRQKNVDKTIVYLNKALADFAGQDEPNVKNNTSNFLNSQKEFLHWFNQLNKKINIKIQSLAHEKIYAIFIKSIKKIQLKLKKSIDTNLELIEHHDQKTEKGEGSAKTNQTYAKKDPSSFIAVLTDPATAIPKIKITKKPWLRNNLYSILNGLVPTALGGFCSLFTYFSGAPNVAKEFGITALDPLFESVTAKVIALAVITIITLYFGYSFIHMNRKTFQRDQEFEKRQKLITNKETDLLTINSKLNLLRKIKKYLENVSLIFTFIRHISSARKNMTKHANHSA